MVCYEVSGPLQALLMADLAEGATGCFGGPLRPSPSARSAPSGGRAQPMRSDQAAMRPLEPIERSADRLRLIASIKSAFRVLCRSFVKVSA